MIKCNYSSAVKKPKQEIITSNPYKSFLFKNNEDDKNTYLFSKKNARSPLAQACLLGKQEEVENIISEFENYESDKLRSGHYGRTPLHFACLGGTYEVYQNLVSKGANVHLTDNVGNTCLHFASLGGTSLKKISDLIARKIDVNSVNNEGKTPLFYAAQISSKKIFELLLKNGANPFLRDKFNKTALHYVNSKRKDEFENLIRNYTFVEKTS